MTRSRCCRRSIPSCGSRSSSLTSRRPRTCYGMFETIRQFAVDRLTDNGDAEATRDRHAAFFAHQAAAHWDHWDGPRWREAVDWVEVELGNLRSAFRWAAARNHVEVATDIAAHAALMGFSVQLFETSFVGRGTDRGRSGRRRAASPPPLHGRRLRLLRRPPRRRSSERPSRHRARGRRRLRPLRAGLLDVHRSPLPGLLRRPRALRRADRRGGAALWCRRGVRPGVVRRRAPVGGTGRGGAGAHRAIGRRGSRPRQPVLDLVRALDRRHGLLPGRRTAGPGGLGRRRGLRAGAPRPVLRGVPGTRRGATAHVRRRAGDRARPLRRGDRGVPSRRQRPAARDHAGQRAGVVRTARALRRRRHAARCDGTAAVELPPRARAGRHRGPA